MSKKSAILRCPIWDTVHSQVHKTHTEESKGDLPAGFNPSEVDGMTVPTEEYRDTRGRRRMESKENHETNLRQPQASQSVV